MEATWKNNYQSNKYIYDHTWNSSKLLSLNNIKNIRCLRFLKYIFLLYAWRVFIPSLSLTDRWNLLPLATEGEPRDTKPGDVTTRKNKRYISILLTIQVRVLHFPNWCLRAIFFFSLTFIEYRYNTTRDKYQKWFLLESHRLRKITDSIFVLGNPITRWMASKLEVEGLPMLR